MPAPRARDGWVIALPRRRANWQRWADLRLSSDPARSTRWSFPLICLNGAWVSTFLSLTIRTCKGNLDTESRRATPVQATGLIGTHCAADGSSGVAEQDRGGINQVGVDATHGMTSARRAIELGRRELALLQRRGEPGVELLSAGNLDLGQVGYDDFAMLIRTNRPGARACRRIASTVNDHPTMSKTPVQLKPKPARDQRCIVGECMVMHKKPYRSLSLGSSRSKIFSL